MQKFLSVIFLCSVLSSQIFSQNSKAPFLTNSLQNGVWNNLKSDMHSFVAKGLGMAETPLHFDKKDYIIMGAVLGTTALSFIADTKIRDGVKRLNSNKLTKFTDIGEMYGSGRFSSYLSGIFYLSGHLLNEKEIRQTGLILMEAVFINGLFTHVLKIGMGRSRPYENESNLDFDGVKFGNEDHSFPSGHTSTAFTISTVLAERFDNPIATTVLYSLASLTAFQRIYSDSHWFSDTVLGAAIGFFIGHSLVKLNSNEEENTTEPGNFNLLPYYNHKSYGLTLNLSL